MSQPSFESASTPTVLHKKSPWNVYTVLLLIAFLALFIGVIVLWLEISKYGGFGAVKGAFYTPPTLGQLPEILRA